MKYDLGTVEEYMDLIPHTLFGVFPRKITLEDRVPAHESR